jgi:hypothetical protein
MQARKFIKENPGCNCYCCNTCYSRCLPGQRGYTGSIVSSAVNQPGRAG